MAKRALVLGGGGVVGIAWETGVLKGLFDAGLDPSSADLIVGTSAGAVVGTQLAKGQPIEDLFAVQLIPPDESLQAQMADIDGTALGNIFTKWAAAPEMTPPVRAEVGAMALAARTGSEEGFIQAIAAMLGGNDWPEKQLIVTAVSAESGEFVTWDRGAGATLERAVASSCAEPGLFPPITINGIRYVDGGVRSGTSADLARGNEVVLVIAPIGASAEGIGGIARRQLDTEVAELKALGSAVEVLLPDTNAMQVFGPNLMDPKRREAAAHAGVSQGAAMGQVLRQLW